MLSWPRNGLRHGTCTAEPRRGRVRQAMTGLTRTAWLVGAVGVLVLAIWLLGPVPAPGPNAPAVPNPLGGPILVVGDRSATDAFDEYLLEMLRTEGWTAFSTRDVSEISAQSLAGVRLVVLDSSTRIVPDVASTLDGFVRGGGALVALRPHPSLETLTGVSATPGRWRLIEMPAPEEAEGARVMAQVFGDTIGLAPNGETAVVASFVSQAGERREDAAVTIHRYGDGRVATFGFDPVRTVAYLRQGNPEWHGEERDGAPGARATDAFAGWIDLERAGRPQADDHLRLLSSIIEQLLADRGGEPRLWYFSAAEPALLVVTADAHASTASAIEAGLGLVEQAGGHMSIYYDPPTASSRLRRRVRRTWRNAFAWASSRSPAIPSSRAVNGWRARGHEFSPHPVIDQNDPETSYFRALADFGDEGFGSGAATLRTHAVYWRGWAASAAIEAASGFGVTLDYYHSGPWLRQADGRWLHTNFTGSYLPMRIVDENGHLLGIRQLTTSMADEQLIASAYDGWEGLNADGAAAVSREVLQRAGTLHGVPVLQFHMDFLEPGHPLRPAITTWISQSLDLAKSRGMPIWNASQLLAFERCREQTRVAGTRWLTSTHLTFRVDQTGTSACAVTVELPRRTEPASRGEARVIVDGASAPGAVVRRGRHELLMLPRGSHLIDVTF